MGIQAFVLRTLVLVNTLLQGVQDYTGDISPVLSLTEMVLWASMNTTTGVAVFPLSLK